MDALGNLLDRIPSKHWKLVPHDVLVQAIAFGERGSTSVTTNLPFDEWTEVFGSERLTGAILDCLIHHVNILEMNGDSYRLNQSRRRQTLAAN